MAFLASSTWPQNIFCGGHENKESGIKKCKKWLFKMHLSKPMSQRVLHNKEILQTQLSKQ